MTTKILLADDHQMVLEGLASLLANEEGLEVVGQARDGRMAVRLVEELSPDVVVMDVNMPEMNGIDATRQVLAQSPDVKVIALSMHSDKRFVLQMLKAGANGYLLKEAAFRELARAIRCVRAGETYLSPKITGVVVDDYVRRGSSDHASVAPVLTPRDREVLQLVAEGKSSKEIAAGLHLSLKTIETHRWQIMRKLDIRSIAGLTKYAIREGLTSAEG